MTDFSELKLLPAILESIEAKGYKSPTQIQERAIPVILKGHDLLGIAQTGTGKTASFSLPLLDRLSRKKVTLKPNHCRAIILAPTRELATQIHKNVVSYSNNTDITSAIIMGGVRKAYQVTAMETGVDIIVATPGRFMDLMGSGDIVLDLVEVFILDEADMMLDMGFYQDVKAVSGILPETRQTIMFSATMPKDIEKLAKSILNKPIKIAVAPQSTTIDKINQSVYFTLEDNKISLLLNLLEDESIKRVLIFCKAKYSVSDIVEALESKDITTGEIHSNRTQTERNEAIHDFTDGNIRVLVATDIASRGIDIDDVTHVINFNMPEDPTFYVHRIGRTARAGREGTAISFCAERDLSLLRNVKKLIGIDIPYIKDQPFHHEYPPLKRKGAHKTSSSDMRKKNRKRPSQAKRESKKKLLEKFKKGTS
jgi:ATP-dependent RNA helicase RhlE